MMESLETTCLPDILSGPVKPTEFRSGHLSGSEGSRHFSRQSVASEGPEFRQNPDKSVGTRATPSPDRNPDILAGFLFRTLSGHYVRITSGPCPDRIPPKSCHFGRIFQQRRHVQLGSL